MSDDTTPPAEPVPAWLLALPAQVEPERQRLDLLLPAATVRRLAELAQAEGRPVEDVAAEQLARALDLAAELAEARDRLPEGEQWCSTCESYEYDYSCCCRRCDGCDTKIAPDLSHELLDLMGEAVLCDTCAAALYVRGYRRRRGPRPARRPPIGPALGL